MRVGVLSYNAQAGDAIGNQVAEKLSFFLERGADVRVLVESEKRLHPAVRPFCQRLERAEPAGEGWLFLSSADLIVVEYGQHYELLNLLPLLAGGKPRILFDYHGVTPPELWSSHNREALEKGARHRGLVWAADAAVAHSRFTKGELQKHTHFPDQYLRVLGHPVDTKHFGPAAAGRDLRRELGLETASVLLFVGRLAPNKRVPLLVGALARLRDLHPPVHAVVIGDTSDLYQETVNDCRARAAELGVSDRVHFLGQVPEDRLLDAYRSADVLVMPSVHEGFCIPVAEAMACGLPVAAARAAALPETIAGAGLSFRADDVEDLARQVRRVLPFTSFPNSVWERPSAKLCFASAKAPETEFPGNAFANGVREREVDPQSPRRLAIVTFRYGTDFVGGAETSLRTIAGALRHAGHEVEVFTTCTQSESAWANHLPEGTVQIEGIPVHRFRVDPHHRAQHLDSVQAILAGEGAVPEEVERKYLRHSIHSTRLLESLGQRLDSFDAVITGPYLYGLTFDVAQAFPEKTVLVPCFHDEPFARLKVWHAAYPYVGGVWFHSPEEKEFAEEQLGLSHPGSVCLGTLVEGNARGNPEGGRARVGSDRPYLVYCGRYSLEKNLPLLLEYAQAYQALSPGRFTFAFLGQGEVPIPRADWARDLGFVDEAAKQDILAGAAALVQLSTYESLSLVALEAWRQGTPVIANRHCRVLAGHLQRSDGGRSVNSFECFAAALDDLYEHPEEWQGLGRQGKDYVRAHFGCRSTFTQLLESSLRDLATPLRERMRRQGLLRAAAYDREKWRERFGRLIEDILESESRPFREEIVVRPRTAVCTVPAGRMSVLVPVRIANRGTHVIAHEGPARFTLRCALVDEAGELCRISTPETPLPGLLLPGQEIAAAMRLAVPAMPGRYRGRLRAERAGRQTPVRAANDRERCEDGSLAVAARKDDPVESQLDLLVGGPGDSTADRCCDAPLEAVHAALIEAEAKQSLPDDYCDVTQGLLASWKRSIKSKLLGNFKHAYVDVLSRQQSAFNQHVVTVLQELAECCALLDHARRTGDPEKRGDHKHLPLLESAVEMIRTAGGDEQLKRLLQGLIEELAESRRQSAALEERLTRLESRLAEPSKLIF
jgi:glycosyltransferase involved in cell wall biosynthesis